MSQSDNPLQSSSPVGTNLPTEIWLRILDHCPFLAVPALRLTCKTFASHLKPLTIFRFVNLKPETFPISRAFYVYSILLQVPDNPHMESKRFCLKCHSEHFFVCEYNDKGYVPGGARCWVVHNDPSTAYTGRNGFITGEMWDKLVEVGEEERKKLKNCFFTGNEGKYLLNLAAFYDSHHTTPRLDYRYPANVASASELRNNGRPSSIVFNQSRNNGRPSSIVPTPSRRTRYGRLSTTLRRWMKWRK